jgi:hypothetical protein
VPLPPYLFYFPPSANPPSAYLVLSVLAWLARLPPIVAVQATYLYEASQSLQNRNRETGTGPLLQLTPGASHEEQETLNRWATIISSEKKDTDTLRPLRS